MSLTIATFNLIYLLHIIILIKCFNEYVTLDYLFIGNLKFQMRLLCDKLFICRCEHSIPNE